MHGYQAAPRHHRVPSVPPRTRETRPARRSSAGMRVVRQGCPNGQQIDFLSVDVEGYDLDVLMSNDWGAYRPSYVVVESDVDDVEEVRRNAIYEFMRGKGYDLVAKTMVSLIFRQAGHGRSAA